MTIAKPTILQLLLRAGSLAAPMLNVEERTIGPSLGAKKTLKRVFHYPVGLCPVAAFMVIYYRLMVSSLTIVSTNILFFGWVFCLPCRQR